MISSIPHVESSQNVDTHHDQNKRKKNSQEGASFSPLVSASTEIVRNLSQLHQNVSGNQINKTETAQNLSDVESTIRQQAKQAKQDKQAKQAKQNEIISSVQKEIACKLIKEPRFDINAKDNNGNTTLNHAISCGQTKIACELIKDPRVDINAKDNNGNTLLNRAIFYGQTEIACELIKDPRVDINAQNNDGRTPFHLSVAYDNRNIATMISKHHDLDYTIQDKNGETVFHAACYRYIEFFDIILNSNKLEGQRILVNIRDKNGNTPLHIVAETGIPEYYKVLEKILGEDGVYLNPQNMHDWTPLHLAAFRGLKPNVILLLSHPGVNLYAKDKDGKTPLYLAHSDPDNECSTILSDHIFDEKSFLSRANLKINRDDINLRDKDCNTSLHRAAMKGYKVTVSRQLKNHLKRADCERYLAKLNPLPESKIEEEYFIDINARNKDNQTPLHLAATNGHSEVVFMLSLPGRFSANAQDNDGRTPLHLAAMNGHREGTSILSEQFDSDVNARDNQGQTALHLAAMNGHLEVVSMLLKQPHIDVNAKNKDMHNALHLAIYFKHSEIVSKLLEKTCIDLNAKDKDGDTALNGAMLELVKHKKNLEACDDKKTASIARDSIQKTIEIITILIMKGALVDVSNTDGKNTRDLAHELGDQKIIDMLPKS